MISFSESQVAVTRTRLTIGQDELHYGDQLVRINNRELPLTDSERSVLLCVLEQKGKVATRGMLFTALYGYGKSNRDIKIVDVFICKIKKKISAISPEIAEHITAIPTGLSAAKRKFWKT